MFGGITSGRKSLNRRRSPLVVARGIQFSGDEWFSLRSSLRRLGLAEKQHFPRIGKVWGALLFRSDAGVRQFGVSSGVVLSSFDGMAGAKCCIFVTLHRQRSIPILCCPVRRRLGGKIKQTGWGISVGDWDVPNTASALRILESQSQRKEVEEMTTILIGIMLISGWYLLRGLRT